MEPEIDKSQRPLSFIFTDFVSSDSDDRFKVEVDKTWSLPLSSLYDILSSKSENNLRRVKRAWSEISWENKDNLTEGYWKSNYLEILN